MTKRMTIALLGVIGSVFAADIGSDTAVTRFNTTQTVENGDRIAGFAALDAGFALGGIDVLATFDSFFPVSGGLHLNFGTLNLNQDLIMQNLSVIQHTGNINGNGHIFELSPSMRCIPVETGADLCSITFTFANIETSSVNTVGFSFDSLYVVKGEGNNLSVDLVVNENFLTNEDSVNLTDIVESVAWHPSKDWIAVGRDGNATGDEIYTYTFSRATGTLTLLDSVNLGGGGSDANSVSWHPDGDHLAVGSDLNATELLVYEIDSGGNFGASTTVNLSRDANTVDWNADGSFLAVGTDSGFGWNELRVYSFVKSPLGLSLDASIGTPRINSISWNKNASANGEIVAGLNSGSNRLRLFRHDGFGTITLLDGVLGTIVNSVDWITCCDCIAVGLQLNSEGTGGELRTFHAVDDVLGQEDDQELGDDVLAVAWAPDGRLLVIGDNGLAAADPSVSLYQFDKVFLDTSFVTFDNVQLVLNGNQVFDFTAIKFTGECSINARGGVLSFTPTFSIVIGSDSSLLLKNMVMAGINGNKLRLTDNTSTVSFQRVVMAIDEDFIFDTGCFEVVDELIIQGDHKFIYQSSCVSKIHSHLPAAGDVSCQEGHSGHLIMDHNTTFSYDTTLSSTLLELQDEYAKFSFNSATLAVTSSLQLTKGRLFFDGKCDLLCGDGLMFGDGTEAGKLYVEIDPAAQLDVSGFLIDNSLQ